MQVQAVDRVAGFLAGEPPSDMGEALWTAAAGVLELAASRIRDGLGGRVQSYPAGELRRLEEAVGRAVRAARLGTELVEADRAEWHDADRELRERAAAAAKAARRRQTLPAEQARLAKRRASA